MKIFNNPIRIRAATKHLSMASIEPEKIKSSWADEMEDDEPGEPHIEIDGDTKIVTEVSLVDGKKFRTIRHYRVEKRKVAKDVARRKTWVKFGLAESDPSTSTTSLTDAVNLEFLASKDEEVAEQDQNNANQFGGNQAVQCRNCGLNHWTLHCPYKTQLNALNKLNENADPNKLDAASGLRKPGLGGKRMELPSRGKDENNTIRITNLPEETQDSDIRDLFKDFGRINRIFLAKDKATGNSKGFAFVSFEMREYALRTIKGVNGHGYNNLILSVEWARPSGN